MNLRRTIARWLGYGGIERKRNTLNFPIRLVGPEFERSAGFVSTAMYPADVDVLVNEIGCDGKNRIVVESGQ